SSPHYFTQTNIVPGILPEGVAGFTEFMKGRVVVPFHGSYHDFDHVIRHELVHVFTLDRLDVAYSKQSMRRAASAPLWFTEGLAEFWSKEWDTEADMIVKDMVVNDRFLPISEMWRVHGSYFMYKLGESICKFIDSAYGPEKLVLLFENWYKGRNFDEIVQVTLGDNLATLSNKWEYALKKSYYPEIADLGLPRMDSRRIVKEGYAVKGVPFKWDDGSGESDWLVFIANRLGYSGIYLMPLNGDGGGIQTLVKGERSSTFESLHFLRSGIDAQRSGKIIFSSKSKEKDVIYLYDLNKKSVIKRFEFDSLIASRSPRFSPDGQNIVFSAVHSNGTSDIYLMNLESGSFERLTSDIYYDVDPVFSLNGEKVVFVSDRCQEGPGGALNIYEIDISSKKIDQLTSGPFRDQSPDITSNGTYFSSDREGTFNLFLLDNNGRLTRQSTYVTGA
ncbi:MAG: hypothetical protein ACREBV_08710, partial [Candidatus Zixiibacteriota bacterium]